LTRIPIIDLAVINVIALLLILVLAPLSLAVLTSLVFGLLLTVQKSLSKFDDAPNAVQQNTDESDFDDEPVPFIDSLLLALSFLGAYLVAPDDSSDWLSWQTLIGGGSLLIAANWLVRGTQGIEKDSKLTINQQIEELWDNDLRQSVRDKEASEKNER
jgi:hypothetical protein